MSPELSSSENLWRKLKSARTKRTPSNLDTAVEEQQKIPAGRFVFGSLFFSIFLRKLLTLNWSGERHIQ